MRRGLAGLVLWALLLVPAVALAGRIYQWTDEKGQVRVTDNLWDLPADVRTRYLELIEEEARTKYTPKQIRELKEAGNWPPLALIRPPTLKNRAEAKEWMGFQIVGNDLDAYKQMSDEFRFQWDSLREEQKRLTQELAAAQQRVASAEQALTTARFEDMVHGRMGDAATVPKAEKDLEEARAALAQVQAAYAGLSTRERDLLLGNRVYTRPGEDGGPGGTFGRPQR
ncbi:MAG: DUF4124 domain-containing protein [Myxococcota bacterium]